MSGLSEDQYAALFAATPVALLVFDADLVMRHANDRYLQATGTTLADIVGRYVFDVFPANPSREYDGADDLEQVMRRAVATGEEQVLASYRYDLPVASGGFETRYWNVNETPIADASGRVELVVHFTEDVTELIREREAREEAARANENLQWRVADAQADLRRRAEELEVLNERLRRASEHDRSVAEALQLAMLTTLPRTESVRLSARYRAAAASDHVGGDWYDAVRHTVSSTTVMIGDVVGHDIGAAALMGQLRSMLRAFAWATEEPPSAIMRQLDRAMRDLKLRTFASAVLANIDAMPDGTCRMTWTNAGHPAPIVVGPDGTTTVLDAAPPTVLLGVQPDTVRPDHEVVLDPGSVVCFYTDGLVEVRDVDLQERIATLCRALTATSQLRGEARIERVIDELVGSQSDDDVAVLLVEVG